MRDPFKSYKIGIRIAGAVLDDLEEEATVRGTSVATEAARRLGHKPKRRGERGKNAVRTVDAQGAAS